VASEEDEAAGAPATASGADRRSPAGTSVTTNAPRGAPPAGTTIDDDTAPKLADLPSPALPKGGGAVRGLGETFEVNGANGTFTASIPIPLSPARGFEPQLALRYDSGAGNGPFGEGWNLAPGSVSRRTDKRLPRYHDDDVFLAGGEDLIPSAEPNGGAWTAGARDAGSHLVRCFRPRVEAAYDRVERWTRKADGDVHWRIRHANGQVSVYGESPQARVSDPAVPDRVYQWLVERRYDERGNLMRFLYRPEDRANVAPTLWEQNRPAVAYTHIDRILYGIRDPFDPAATAPDDPAAYLFEIVFDYGERDGISDEAVPPYPPPATWPMRPDAFSNFKPGFDLRCYRVCKRILVFHRAEELGPGPTLVRELRLRYDGDPSLAKLVGATGIGWNGATQLKQPEVRFDYTRAAVDPTVRQLDAASAENLPPPVDGARTQWVDLDGEGIPGALVEDRPGLFYKRNLGGGALGPAETLPNRPALSLAAGGQLLDVAGDGTKSLVRFGTPAPGHFARTRDFEWAPFAPFRSLPSVGFADDPNLRFIDLDGDGRSDVLVTEDQRLRWYPSLGYDGFAPAELVGKPRDEQRGPALVFADAEQALYLADMTGDGLTDLVRIRNGEICYWPNLGYGRFGRQVRMANAPRFASGLDFNRAQLRLADIDGSGTTDLLYCEGDRVRYWLNLAGNRFGDEQSIAGLPYDGSARIDAVDLLGDGTSCLVWTSPLAGHARQPLRFVSLTGGTKPHLLSAIDNALGRAVQIEYAPSTRFYLQDRAAGHPWVTRAPFPVQVVERLTTMDQVTGGRLGATYSYHHGFYDPVEREFRGFGMVERSDVQTLSALESQGLFPAGVDDVPPARTRTWYHTGAFFEADDLIARFRTEWFALDPDEASLDGGVMPTGLDPGECREAVRALRGRPLRVETYADDSPALPQTPIPYRVVEHNYQVRTLERRGSNAHAAFAVDPLETLTTHYERNAADPRVEHELVLAVGPYGGIESRARVGYPRRGATSGLLATLAEQDLLARDQEAELFRVNVVSETRLFQVTGLVSPTLSPFVLSRAELGVLLTLPGTADDLAFDGTPNPTRLQRRLVRQTRLQYLGDDDLTPAAPGSFGRRALLQQAQRAVLPVGMVPALLPATVDAGAMLAAGYVQHDGSWWSPSSTLGYDGTAFFQPTRFQDPFGNAAEVAYDAHALAPARVTNAFNQTVVVTTDYRALAPSAITDVNGNTTLAGYDPLGQLTDVAKTGRQGEGDTLAAPTVHHDYTLSDWRTLGTPNFSATRRRIVHGGSEFQESRVYADGFGRELQTKMKANPGPALAVQNGARVTVDTNDRWLASGRTVYDNQGNAVRKYEPFFAVGPAYESDPLLAFLGVSATRHYDPIRRLVRTDRPDGSFSTTTIGAWEVREADGDDNVDEEGRLWATRPGQTAADQRAVAAARLHRRTPARYLGDALGRRLSTFADNTAQGAAVDVPEANHVLYETRLELDIEGRPIALHDDRGLNAVTPYAVLTQARDMLGRALRSIGADTGPSFALPDCQGRPFYSRDARGIELRTSYDVLRRVTEVQAVDTSAGTSFTAEKTVYGDDPIQAPHDPTAYLLGRVYQVFDQAGVLTTPRYDFKGNALVQARTLIVAYDGVPDWTQPYLTPFEHSLDYDALDRPIRTVLPRRSNSGTPNAVTRVYLPHGPVEKVTVETQFGAAVNVIHDIDYDAKGRRVSAAYGNGIQRTYDYDPLTFRLAAMTATRGGGAQILQQISYTYDAVGNATEITDSAQPTIFNNNQQVDPRLAYTYDSTYRLTGATGRELRNPVQPGAGEAGFGSWPPNANDLVNYAEQYDYDSAGNIIRVRHAADNNTTQWTRGYGYDPASNRLTGTSVPGAPDPTVFGDTYSYDLAGNLISASHLAPVDWDERGRLASADRLGGGVVYCRYDASGQRMRKVQTRQVAAGGGVVYERIYLGEYELFRALDNTGTATQEIESVHGLDGGSRIVLIETDTTATAPAPVTRYQLDNHLGSAIVETDESAALLSYEEFHPFGTTAFQASAGLAEVSLKRYRFLGKERDSETGFYYCDARHLCAWLGRWISPDPKGVAGGINLYAYARNNPICARDPGGQDPDDPPKAGKKRSAPHVPDFHLRPHIPQVPPPLPPRPQPSHTPYRLPPPLPITAFYPNYPFPEPEEEAPEAAHEAQHHAETPPPAPASTSTDTPPIWRPDFQGVIFGGHDFGSGGPAVQTSAALTFPHLSLTRKLTGDDWSNDSTRWGYNVLSGAGPVLQFQQLGASAPTNQQPTYTQQFSYGAAVNLIDVQYRRDVDSGTTTPKYEQGLIDFSAQAQLLGQHLWGPSGGAPNAPRSLDAVQFSVGLQVDVHLDRHFSLFVQPPGIQFSSAGPPAPTPFFVGIGFHSEAQ
jgi:RHS repeat-associated protein